MLQSACVNNNLYNYLVKNTTLSELIFRSVRRNRTKFNAHMFFMLRNLELVWKFARFFSFYYKSNMIGSNDIQNTILCCRQKNAM